jgi:hypothetical protein
MHVASIWFKYFHVFHTYVCKRFIWMLHMFAMVFKGFLVTFSQVFQTLVSSVSSIFFCMLQLLYLDVLKVDRILRMAVGSGWRCGRHSGWCEPLLVCSLASPIGAHLLPVRAPSGR